MPFPQDVKTTALVACQRCCCICHIQCGVEIECHHIAPESEGGSDDLENCIPLCFNCHAKVGHYNPKHGRGNKFTPEELRQHRDSWFEKVHNSRAFVESSSTAPVDCAIFDEIRKMLPGNEIISSLGSLLLSTNENQSAYLQDIARFVHWGRNIENEFIDADLESVRAELVSRMLDFYETKSLVDEARELIAILSF
jgi:hypothetical protein